MKIIIYNPNSKGLVFTAEKGVHIVSCLESLETLINRYPNEDIEGEIRPSARNNPELNDILLAIYDHKLTLWKLWSSGSAVLRNSPPHEKFIQVLVKNGIELKYEFSMNVNKNANSAIKQARYRLAVLTAGTKPMWVGTRDEYVAIPVKDPDTIYSIVN